MSKYLKKNEVDDLNAKIGHQYKLVWDVIDAVETKAVFDLSEKYKLFLDKAKTEREAVAFIQKQAAQNGFVDIDIEKNSSTGKFYKIHRSKAIALGIAGKSPILSGMHIIASHIDSPRLDLKQNPIYEKEKIAFFKTHYYGGIKKYQWLVRPLAIHGTIIKNNQETVNICIGESDNDPVFTIADLLPHLAAKIQTNKKISEAFEAEKLNIIIGSIPIGDEKIKKRFKTGALKHIFDKYDIVEEDFTSAEIEVVPAGKARDIGFDRSLIGAYGQDDRICAFTSLETILNINNPKATSIVMFFDKEEIGSEGNTGAKSRFLEDFISDMQIKTGQDASERVLRKALINSSAISADVNAALDPDFQNVHEKRNAARLGYGICIKKFTGSRGKAGASDASAEYLGKIRHIFNDSNIIWQTGELGKVDQGGGGTVAKFLAKYGMDILDCGPCILAMHSPMEISSKADVYMTYKGYKAFLLS